MQEIKTFLVNPLTIWVAWLARTISLKIRNFGQCLRIGYMAGAKRSRFGRYNTLYDYVFLDNVVIGDMSYVSRGTRIANTKIGKFTCIGPDTTIGLGRHPTSEFVSSHPAFYSMGRQSQITFVNEQRFDEFQEISIGNDVWIGARVVVLDGAVIGDGAIVASGAVVSGIVPPYAIVGGVPAKTIKYRFTETQIEALRRLRWWDRDFDWLKDNILNFQRVELLIREAGNPSAMD